MLQEIWRAAVYLKDTVRASIYDAFIVSFTAKWYSAVLNRLPEGAHILDVGIGTGTALLRNASQIRDKKIRVTGVDYDQSYVLKCKKEIAEHDLEQSVSVVHASIYDFLPDSSEGEINRSCERTLRRRSKLFCSRYVQEPKFTMRFTSAGAS
mmetsp:Transcript_26885/g.104342  ORF Transcript_26885/g.104342 Transcript_26885/m.104342 type:complete len:152 (+) Transcript_26885:1905-2360(+)